MTGSKQNHLRYANSRRLNNLVGRQVQIFECGDDSSNQGGLLEKRNDGFYCNEKKLPLRSINRMSYLDYLAGRIEVCSDYLETYKGNKQLGVLQ